ncbi:alpha/beta hydrolase [Nocardia sp. NPDC004278]
MISRHLLDPALEPILANASRVDLSNRTLPEARAWMGSLFQSSESREDVVTVERWLPGDDGGPDIRVLITRSARVAEHAVAAVLWIHGGGYCLGDAAQDQALLNRIVVEHDFVAVSVDYRLAPENPHPGPLRDCYLGLRWIHEHAAELNIDPGRIVVAGESAGGGLAATLTQLARDRAEVAVRLQVLLYPMLDDRPAAEPHPYTGEFIWTRDDNAIAWRHLLGAESGAAHAIAYASVARADDLTGLPPAFLIVGALDLFLDENLAYARRLLRAGVPTELHVHPGQVHGYRNFDTDFARRLYADLDAALRVALDR